MARGVLGWGRSRWIVGVALIASAMLLPRCGGRALELEGAELSTGGASGGRASSGGVVASGGVNTGGTTGGVNTGGSTPVDGRPVPPDDACVAGVLARNVCSTVCHTRANAAIIGSNLVLEGTNLGARLSMTQATYQGVTTNMAACVPGNLIIDRSKPTNSLLLKKLLGTQECGDSMPPGTGLRGDDAECIRSWVLKF